MSDCKRTYRLNITEYIKESCQFLNYNILIDIRHLFVSPAITESLLSISGPDELYAEQSNLSREHRLELHQFKALVTNNHVGLSYDVVNGLLDSIQ